MAETKVSFRAAEEMPPVLIEAVLQWTLAVADTKQVMGLQFSHWVTGTPALEAAVGSAAIAQDELGHARSLHALLRVYPGAPEGIGAENDLEARDTYFAPAALAPRWESWYQVIAINVLLDRALEIAIGATTTSAFAPLAGRAAKILQEERFHRVFGDNWLARLSHQHEAARASLQQQIAWAWDITNQWLGPDGDPIAGVLGDHGVLSASVAEMRQAWLDAVKPVLTHNGLTIPASTTEWTGWDARFRHLQHA